jgi:alpha-galactosidase
MRNVLFLTVTTSKISRFVLAIFILCGTSSLVAQKNVLTIPLGKNSRLVYDLNNGSYKMISQGHQLFTNGYAAYTAGIKNSDTRQAGAASYTVKDTVTPMGTARLYRLKFTGDASLVQLFYIFKSQDYFFTQIQLVNPEGPSDYIAPLITTDLSLKDSGDKRALYVPFDNDMWARYNASPLVQADFKSSELTAVYNADNNQGFVAASLDQYDWKTGVAIKATGANTATLKLFAGFADSTLTHDRITHGKVLPVNGVISSPLMLVGYFNDWRTGMEYAAKFNGMLHKPDIFNWDRATPMGWNSWGVLKDKITFDQAMKVVDFFGDSVKNFRNADSTLYIDLDAFWDNMTTNGIDGDVSKLKAFADRCKSKGLKPGIYWTPFADWGKWDRKVEGAGDYTYAQTWTTQKGKMYDIDGGRAMDPTHPATKLRIGHTLNKMKALGFEMIKIDFLGHGALEADRFYDKNVTTGMQAFRQGMKYLDSVLDGKMLVYAAISPNLATSKYVHVRRIACDAWSSIDHTEYTLNSTGYGWWQSLMYNYVDADHVVFAGEEDGVNRARLASALVTGSVFTGDDYSSQGKWTATAKKLLQDKGLLAVVKDGKSFKPVKANTGNKGVEVFEKYVPGGYYLAFFNYSENEKHISQILPAGVRRKAARYRSLFSGGVAEAIFGGLNVTLAAKDAEILFFSR